MKAVILGITVGVLAVLGLVKFDSRAEATCEGCGQQAFFANLASDLDVDNNTNRKFEDDGDFAWCIVDATPTLVDLDFVEAESEDVHDVTILPNFVSGAQPCSSQISVSVEGFLDELDEVGTCVINGFVWSPFVEDNHTFTVHEL